MSKLRETKRSLFHWVKKGVSTEREIITFCHEIIIIMDSWDNETSDVVPRNRKIFPLRLPLQQNLRCWFELNIIITNVN